MRSGARAWASAITAIAVVVPLTAVGPSFAAGGLFRHSRGEPLPDPHLTPGATFNVSVATVCRRGYATSVRDVPESEKQRAYAEYGVLHHATDQYEIDHLIPLELGGNNSLANLWPELNDHPHGFLNTKDILENRLHSLVCTGAMSLRSAQTRIASNWVLAYHRYMGVWPSFTAPTPVTSTTRSTGTNTPPGSSGVRITSVLATVAPGGTETLHAHSARSGDSCDLTVVLASGRHSTAKGLGVTSTDVHGDATWSWRIGSDTGAGVAHVTVTCEDGVAQSSFIVT